MFFLDPATGRCRRLRRRSVEPVHRLHPARRRRLGHQHHRLRTCRTRWCTSSISGVEYALWGVRARIDGVHNTGHALPDRPHGRRGVQSGRRRPRPRGQHRVERARRSTTRCCCRLDRQFAGGHAFRLGYTLAKAFNYANDDQIPFSERSDRSQRPAPRIRPDAERSPPSVRRLGAGAVAGRVHVAALWTASSGVPMDIMMPDGQTRIPVLQRNAGGRQFQTAVGAQHLPHAAQRRRRRERRAAAAGLRTAPASTTLQLARPARVAAVRARRAASASSRWSRCSTCSTSTNVLGMSIVNYSGFSNVLVRDSEDARHARIPPLEPIRSARDDGRRGVRHRAARAPCSWRRA